MWWLQKSQALGSPITELAKRLGIPLSEDVSTSFVDEINDKELLVLSSRLAGQSLPASDQVASIQVIMPCFCCNPPASASERIVAFLCVWYQGTSWSLEKFSSKLTTTARTRTFAEGLSTSHPPALFVWFQSSVFPLCLLFACLTIHFSANKKQSGRNFHAFVTSALFQTMNYFLSCHVITWTARNEHIFGILDE